MEDFKKLIDRIMEAKSLKQQDIARMLGYDHTYLSQMLNGKKSVSKKTLEKVNLVFPDIKTTIIKEDEPNLDLIAQLIKNNSELLEINKRMSISHERLTISHDKLATSHESITSSNRKIAADNHDFWQIIKSNFNLLPKEKDPSALVDPGTNKETAEGFASSILSDKKEMLGRFSGSGKKKGK